MHVKEKIDNYVNLGMTNLDAIAKVCGEIILLKISKSSKSHNITVKGGVVMMNISKDLRRTTRDLDIDFIKHSLSDNSIEHFIIQLNNVNDGIKLEIIHPIKELKHQDYSGKRVNLKIVDGYENQYKFKLDIGIHKKLDAKQENLCFNLNSIPKSVTLLANSKEQIVVEKLRSLLKLGSVSGRYKDVFDIYYLINLVDKTNLCTLIDEYILNDPKMWENNYSEICQRLSEVFADKDYIVLLSTNRDNWLELPIEKVVAEIISFFDSLVPVKV